MTSYRIVRHMTLFVQKILIDSNHQEFDMKQMRQKYVVCIVLFDLVGLLPSNHIISYFTKVYTRAYEADVKSFKTAQTMQNILKFYCWKFKHTGNGKLWR